jgi:hypothetical protein
MFVAAPFPTAASTGAVAREFRAADTQNEEPIERIRKVK